MEDGSWDDLGLPSLLKLPQQKHSRRSRRIGELLRLYHKRVTAQPAPIPVLRASQDAAARSERFFASLRSAPSVTARPSRQNRCLCHKHSRASRLLPIVEESCENQN